MIEMRVENLMSDRNSDQELVWLRSVEGSVVVPIEIGHTEYLSIYSELADERLPRPLTHDLLRTVLEHFDAEVEEVQIVDLREGIFYAELVLAVQGEQVRLDARPSDSIALALKFGAPIYMDGKIIQQVGFKAHGNGLDYLEPLNPTAPQSSDVGEESAVEVAHVVDDLVAGMQAENVKLPDGDIDPDELLGILKEQMGKAVKEERYEDAGMIRDEIDRIEATKESKT
ncbi:MAG: DUF151 domain-containing protein [Candidatus Latescibacteria bacterium]|nr:DUF151 domain-containing protein [Candidatus Latescibacterota bacterium]